MSGFVALLDRNGGGVDRERLQAMLDKMDHRGPDGSGTWCDDWVMPGHQELQSTPESRFDDQPYYEDGQVIVGNFRVDNRDGVLTEHLQP